MTGEAYDLLLKSAPARLAPFPERHPRLKKGKINLKYKFR